MRGSHAILVMVVVAACGAPSKPAAKPSTQAPLIETVRPPRKPPPPPEAVCGSGKKLRIAFYDAGQALAALVTLPNGQQILVDAGEYKKRVGCKECAAWNARVLAGLTKDLGAGGRIDLLWNTHPHSDHLGGVPSVADAFEIAAYARNGRDESKKTVADALAAATKDKATLAVVEPGNAVVPLSTEENVKLTAIVPAKWPGACGSDPNACSIMLRIDYCSSSVLFTGDGEEVEESLVLDQLTHVDLLQVGHHGSDTSTTPEFLAKLSPKYAVISAGKRDEGTNDGYCHPIRSTVDALTVAMGGAGSSTMLAYDNSKTKCKDRDKMKTKDWVDVPASDTLWNTARDGEIVLTTTGDGEFTRE